MDKKTLGLFGDSYIETFPKMNNWSYRLGEVYNTSAWGKGGSNLYYAIDCWHQANEQLKGNKFDYVVFTLTWQTRLYSFHKDRNDYFCFPNSYMWNRPEGFNDPEIKTPEDFKKFEDMVQNYHRYLYDDHWARFTHDLEIKYIMDLAASNPETRFVFIPNTALSRDLAKKHHTRGVLLDFAFEDVSNQDPGCPGKMPIRFDNRVNHISVQSQKFMYEFMTDLLWNYDIYQDQILPMDLAKFHIDSK